VDKYGRTKVLRKAEYERRKKKHGVKHLRRLSVEAYKHRQKWAEGLKNRPCSDCKRRFPPECMDWDHVRGRKLFTLGNKGYSFSKQRVLLEIAKCDLVCANCHKIRTRRKARGQG